MKITGRRLANVLSNEYAFYRRLKKFGKAHASRITRRRLKLLD